MRSLPIGWALPLDRWEERRSWAISLSRATHPGAEACVAACVGAACASWALEGADSALILEVAREEAIAAVRVCRADASIIEMLAALTDGDWHPNPECGLLDPYETLLRVLSCIDREHELAPALLTAVQMGGDTDTVAALVGGIIGCGHPPDIVRAQLPWAGLAQVPDNVLLGRLATGLGDVRVGRGDH